MFICLFLAEFEGPDLDAMTANNGLQWNGGPDSAQGGRMRS